MERKIRRSERKLSDEDAKLILNRALYGVLSTISEDDTPYGVPMSYAYNGEAIYLHCAPEGHRLDNIVRNPNVSFTVVDSVETLPEKFSTKYQSVIVFGIISVVEAKEEKRKGILEILKKYSPDFYDSGLKYMEASFDKMKVLKIEISRMTGKARL